MPVNVNFTPICVKVTRELRKQNLFRSLLTVNGKINSFKMNEKLAFDRLYKLPKREAVLLKTACKSFFCTLTETLSYPR